MLLAASVPAWRSWKRELAALKRFAATLLRPARARSVAASRRRAVLLRFARTAALRLQGAADPMAVPEPG